MNRVTRTDSKYTATHLLEVEYKDFDSKLGAGQLGILAPIVDDLLWMIPPSVQRITIWYDECPPDEASSAAASCSMSTAYHTFKIIVYPLFFQRTPEQGRETMIHELAHAIINPVYNTALDMLKIGLGTENPTFKMARQAIEDSLEHAITGLTRVLQNCEGPTRKQPLEDRI